MSVYHPERFIEYSSSCDDIKKIVTDTFPARFGKSWEVEENIAVEKMSQGLSNSAFIVKNTSKSLGLADTCPRELVFRINNTESLIDRSHEMKIIKFLGNASIAAKVVASYKNAVCYEFNPGKTITVEQLRSFDFIPILADMLAKFHSIPDEKLDVFEIKCCPDGPKTLEFSRDYFRKIFGMKEPVLPELWSEFNFEEMLSTDFLKTNFKFRSKINSRMTFCHHDLCVGNIILAPNNNKSSLIDFEFTGPGFAAFDIANLFTGFTGKTEIDYVKHYPGEKYRILFIREYLARKIVHDDHFQDGGFDFTQEIDFLNEDIQKSCIYDDLLWAFWAVYTFNTGSDKGFDFIGYAEARFVHLLAILKEVGMSEKIWNLNQ